MTANSRIAATAPALLLAQVLAGEILQTTERQLAAGQGDAAAGDFPKTDPQLKGEGDTLEVSAGRTVVTGANYAAAAFGTVTLLQALAIKGGKLSLPHLVVANGRMDRMISRSIRRSRDSELRRILR